MKLLKDLNLKKIDNSISLAEYKREKVEEDILDYAVSKMELLEIFLDISKEKIHLEANNY